MSFAKFLKRNWLYVILFCFIVGINVLFYFEKRAESEKTAKVEAKTEIELEEEKEPQILFVDFEEAKRKTQKIESLLKRDLPRYLFYMALNLSIVFIFILGLTVDGYFIFSRFRKKDTFQKIRIMDPPPWKISDVLKIIILALSFGYIFFISFGFLLGILEPIMKIKFAFYRNRNFRMTFDTIILDFIVLLIVLRFLWHVYRKRFATLGFVKENMTRNVLYGICGYLGVIPIIFIIGILVYILLNILKLKPPPQPIVQLFLVEKNVALIFVTSVIASIFGPVIEEIFFRGIMYNAIKGRLGVFGGIFITSLLFSFLHTHAMTYFLVGFIPIAILGAVLAYLYEKTGSLIPSITLHILNNMGSVFMVFLFKYFNHLV